MIIKGNRDTGDIIVAGKKTYHEIKTDRFDIDKDEKSFYITTTEFMSATGLTDIPWLRTTNAQIAEGDKNIQVPRIRLVSSDSGKRCTFFLNDRTADFYQFQPSIGSLLNKSTGLPHLKGWKILMKRG